jgi:hypothetical protein
MAAVSLHTSDRRFEKTGTGIRYKKYRFKNPGFEYFAL